MCKESIGSQCACYNKRSYLWWRESRSSSKLVDWLGRSQARLSRVDRSLNRTHISASSTYSIGRSIARSICDQGPNQPRVSENLQISCNPSCPDRILFNPSPIWGEPDFHQVALKLKLYIDKEIEREMRRKHNSIPLLEPKSHKFNIEKLSTMHHHWKWKNIKLKHASKYI